MSEPFGEKIFGKKYAQIFGPAPTLGLIVYGGVTFWGEFCQSAKFCWCEALDKKPLSFGQPLDTLVISHPGWDPEPASWVRC